MKILRIRLKNIHSLNNTFEIDLENGALADAGLFAIVGPTGAGKSTLLDVITLAIYGEIPRYSGRITKNVIEEHGLILSTDAEDCFAEVEYEVKNKQYRSNWSIKKNRNGNLNPQKHDLHDLSSDVLIASGTNVSAENIEIIQLNYEQFIQSMLLAQGKFSKLLLAKQKDRNKLLEEITGGKIYRDISIKAHLKHSEVKKLYEEKLTQIDLIEVLDQETRRDIEQEILKHQKAIPELEKKVDELQKKVDAKKLWSDCTTKIAQEKEALNKHNQLFIDFKPKIQLLKKHEEIAYLKEDFFTWNELRKNTNEKNKTLESTQKDLKKSEEKIQTNKKNVIAFLQNDAISEENYSACLDNFRKEVQDLIQEEEKAKNEAKNKGIFIQDKIQQLKTLEVNIEVSKNTQNNIVLIQKELTKITKTFENSEFKSELELKNALEKIIGLNLEANKLLYHKKDESNTNKSLQENEKQISEAESFIKSLNKTLQKKEALLIKEQKEQEHLHSRFEIKNTQKKLEDYRAQLKEGEPCPLCGSLEHPLHQEEKENELSTLEQLLKLKQEKVEDLKQQIIELKVNTKGKKEEITRLKKQQGVLKEELESSCKKINDLNQNLKWNIKESLKDWEEHSEKLNAAQLNLEGFAKQFKAKSILEDCKVLGESYHELKSTYLQKQEKRKALYTGNDVVRDCNQLNKQLAESIQNRNYLQEQLQKTKQELASLEKSLKVKDSYLKQEITKYNLEEINDLSSVLLKENEAQNIRKKEHNIQQEIVKTQQEIARLQALIAEKDLKSLETENLEKLENTYETLKINLKQINQKLGSCKEQIKYDDAQIQKQKTQKLELKSYAKDLHLWEKMKMLIGSGDGSKFSNFVQDLSMAQLIEYGNVRLRQFTDRYLMYKSDKADEDSIKIMDTHMGNQIRSVNTLSGGETFKLSLALALGLSDMASRNVNIESLFIDEGFGALDSDSLEEAISLLESIQSENNKSIGVISHVSELKNRIHCQVKLQQNNNGFSSITIVQ